MLPGNTCDINQRVRSCTPTISFLDAPLVEDMLHNVRTGLTKVIVTGPGRAVLFLGRHLLGEGLTIGEARDAAFLHTGVGMWVGKPAYLAGDPLTIQEG